MADMAGLDAGDKVCDFMVRHAAAADAWLDCVARRGACAGEGIMSSFERECALAGGRTRRVVDRIEPLVGHLRHPHGLPARVPPGRRGVGIEDRGYLLLSAPPAHRRRTFLFDAGTAAFNSSLAWFWADYGKLGVTFDEIHAWEARPMNATEYFAGVPPAVANRLAHRPASRACTRGRPAGRGRRPRASRSPAGI